MDKTVAKAFNLFELLAKNGRPSTLAELTTLSRLQKSNVHRLLATLMMLGYVRQTSASLYEPTLRAWEIGQRVYAQVGFVRAARPFLNRLVEQTGESSHLAIFDRNQVIYLDKVESPNPVRVYTEIGGRAPAYCTASGKLLLAYQDPKVVEDIAKSITTHTPATISDIKEFRAEMARVQRRGYATNLGEFRMNVGALAAPIRDSRNEVIAAIGISGPLDRLRPRTVRSYSRFVIAAAVELSSKLSA